MKITIGSVDNQVFLHEGKDALRIEFSSSIVRGSAILVSNVQEIKVGDEIYVEVDYAWCDNFVAISANGIACMKYQEEADFYTVEAPASAVFEDGILCVGIEDLQVMVEPVENLHLEVGNWLQFDLHELSLWPTNL